MLACVFFWSFLILMENQKNWNPYFWCWAAWNKHGKGGIRTLGNREVTSVFKTDAIDHSATFPFLFWFPLCFHTCVYTGGPAGNAIRTRDMHLGKVPLYHWAIPASFSLIFSKSIRFLVWILSDSNGFSNSVCVKWGCIGSAGVEGTGKERRTGLTVKEGVGYCNSVLLNRSILFSFKEMQWTCFQVEVHIVYAQWI